MEQCADELSVSEQSSGSFEAVSEDEHSFTVINAENLSISKEWEITTYSSTADETDESDETEFEVKDPLTEKEVDTVATSTDEKEVVIPLSSGIKSIEGELASVSAQLLESDEEKAAEPTLLQSTMSKSAILGVERLSQADVIALQSRNRSHFKRINRLSELLDNEKKVSAELLETVMKKTEENVVLLETIENLKLDLRDTQKKLRKKNQECSKKDALIASLKTFNELPRKLDESKKRDEQVFPHGHRLSEQPKYSVKCGHVVKEVDRTCDIGVIRPTSGSNTKHHRLKREHKEKDEEWKYRLQGSHYPQTYHSSKREPDASSSTTRKQLSENLCPVCNRQMPPNLTEKQMTLHVESCLQKREA